MILNMSGGSGGSGGGLNFTVKQYADISALPATAAENDIAVITAATMNGWAFDAVEPASPAEGMVWIEVGAASEVAFNLLKKNAVYVYPVSVWQYSAGAWATVDAWIHQNSIWTQFSELITAVYLYNAGDVCEAVTGGYAAFSLKPTSNPASNGSPSISYGETSMTISSDTTYATNGGIARTVEKVDLSSFKKIVWEGTRTGGAEANISVWSSMGSHQQENRVATQTLTTAMQTAEIDISDLSGEHYIGFGFARNGSGQAIVETTSLRLE